MRAATIIWTSRWTALALALTAACSDGPAGSPIGPDTGADADAAVYGLACAAAERVGRFEIGHHGFYSAVSGEVRDGVVPLEVLREVAREGECALMQRVIPFCDPPCDAGDVCDHGGACRAYPRNLAVGVVTVEGLSVPVTMTPNAVGTYAETDLPPSLFAEGAPITLHAHGDALPAFTLSAFGVPPLSAPSVPVQLARGQPSTVTWDAAPGAWRVRLELSVDQHGSSPGRLVCDVADAGAHTIPAALVDALLDLGTSGVSSLELRRRTVDHVDLEPGCVELTVFSAARGLLAPP